MKLYEVKPEFYIASEEILNNSSTYITYITFFLITIPVIYEVCNKFKNKEIIYELTRENYNTFKKKLFINSYKNSIIVPLSLIITFIILIIFTKDFNTSHFLEETLLNEFYTNVKSPYLYIITILIKSFLISIIYINISLIISRKRHNTYISALLSFLMFIAIELILQLLIGNVLLDKIFGINGISSSLSILNIFTINLNNGYLSVYVPIIIILILSFIILHIKYKDKEKLIIDCEKNI